MVFKKLNRNVLLLAGAVGLGLLAALLSVSYVQKRAEEARLAATPQSAPQVQVVVPMRDIAAGDIVTARDMVSRGMPEDLAPVDALVPGSHEAFVGRIARTPIRRGTPISAGALIAPQEQFSRIVSPGRVAYNFSVNENNSISGMVMPGDRIDILMTYKETKGSDGLREGPDQQGGGRVVPLLENILVLATGVQATELPGDERPSFSSVTLELDPRQAEQLTIAQKTGEMRVVLRNLEDRTPFGLSGMTERSLLAEFERYGSSADEVEYIIGGRN